jgi:hypothetical protein
VIPTAQQPRPVHLRRDCSHSICATLLPQHARIDAHSAAAANLRHTRHAHTSHSYPGHAYASHRHGPWFAHGATLPYGPEYGFLRRVPPNAIGGPGYTFVPGVGILGESCDLPTTACTNEYRDVR